MLELQRIVAERGMVEAVLGAHVRIRVGHLYPEYLNIYADRGNIAVLARRAALRGHELAVAAISVEDEVDAGAYDLFYIGGGQDREQALIAPGPRRKGPGDRAGGRTTAPRCSRSAAGISCSGAATWAATATRCRGSASSRTRPSPESSG